MKNYIKENFGNINLFLIFGKLVKEYKAARPEKYNKEIQSDSYRYYTYAKENKLLKEPKENPTLEDVKQLYELQKQWTKASK